VKKIEFAFPIGRLLYSTAFATVILLSGCTNAPKAPSVHDLIDGDYSVVIDYLREYIPYAMKKHDITGMSVALVDDQKIVWSDGFGFADKSAAIVATDKHLYRAGSVSKLFTALAVMKLVQDSRLKLDAPIRDSVPEFNLKSRFGMVEAITLRNILSHHSGIPGDILDGMWAHEPDSFKTVASRLHRYYAASPPNTVSAYSNAGFSVAGHAVENASGLPFSDYVRDTLLVPMGMTQSNIRMNTSSNLVAKSYWKGEEVQELGLRDLPAGGLVTTVRDLSKLIVLANANGFHRTQILEPETMQQMLRVQRYDSIYEIDGRNGIGWQYFDGLLNNQYAAVGHRGQALAHSASLMMTPELKLGVVLLANSPNRSNGLAEITGEMLRAAHAVKTATDLDSIPEVEKTTLPGTEANFDGKFVSEAGYIEVVKQAQDYQVNALGRKLTLSPDKNGTFRLRFNLLGLVPINLPQFASTSFYAREVAGVKLLIAKTPSKTHVFATPAKFQPRVPEWDSRLGNYKIENPLEAEIPYAKLDGATLGYENEFYHLTLNTPIGKLQIPLTIVNESEVIIQGFGRRLGETIFFQPNGSILVQGIILRKVP